MDLLGFENYDDLKDAHHKWVDSAMQTDNRDKEKMYSYFFRNSFGLIPASFRMALNVPSGKSFEWLGTMD